MATWKIYILATRRKLLTDNRLTTYYQNMIDPSDVIKFDRTDSELEEFWLFCCIVAGKTAASQARLLDKFLTNLNAEHPSPTPFGMIRLSVEATTLPWHTRFAHLGQYRRIDRCFEESLKLDLRNDPVEAFEEIYGVGPKTARMFMMHSRPNQRLAALDTHLLKHLKANGYKVPKATPSSAKQYKELEQVFLKLADDAGQSAAEYDLMIWKKYAKKLETN